MVTRTAEPESSSSNRVQSLDRALDIIEALADAGGDVTLSELSQQVQLHISTVYRLLSVLVARGYAQQNSSTRQYALGPQVLKLAAHAVGAGLFDLRREALPALNDLSARSDETVNLVVMPDMHIVYIEQVPSTHIVRMFTQIGSRAPAYCTGAGKAILAFRGKHEIARYLRSQKLERHTSTTIVTAAELLRQLEGVRREGYAVDAGEMEDGVHCVAAPVFDHTGAAVAAISISGPASRFTDERIRETAPALLEVTSLLSKRLGYRDHPRDHSQRSE